MGAIGRVVASVPEATVMDVYNSVSATAPIAAAPTGDSIGTAAAKLSAESYPFLKSVDWLSPIYLKAIDKAIVMGASMNGDLLKQAAAAHHKAIGSIDAKGVTSAADYEAVNAAIGRIVASVPKSKVMDVFNAFKDVVGPTIPNNMFALADPLAASQAAKAFYEFKDVVQAAQR